MDTSETRFEIKSALVKSARTVHVPAEHPGVLVELGIKEGQFVKKGELIGKIKDTDLQLELKRAEQNLEVANKLAENDVDIRYAEKTRDVAIAEVKRSQAMNERIPDSVPYPRLEKQQLERDRTILQLEKANRDFQVAKLKAQMAKTEVQMARQAIMQTEIRAPMDGMVVAIEKQKGEWIESSQTVANLVQTDQLRIEGMVTADRASQLKLGMPVKIRFAQKWIDREFDGIVSFINHEANPINLSVAIWVDIRNDDQQQIIPGIRGDILVDLGKPVSANSK